MATALPHKPRLELFSDPTARAVWSALCTLDEAAQHEVLLELRRRLARRDLRDRPQDARRAEAVRSLREVANALGRSPSVRDYREVRAKHPEQTWAEDRNGRAWLGARSWNEALGQAGLDHVPDGEVLIVENGGAFSEAEVAAAVKAAAAELGQIPSFTSYLSWARRPDVKAREGRRPTSQGVFDRLFPESGFRGTLAAAGLVASDSPTGLAGGGSRRPAGYRYTDTEIREALVEVAKRAGTHPAGPRVTQFTRTRALILAEEEGAGKPPRAFPTYHAIHDRYPGCWDRALVAAGLRPLGGAATAVRRQTGTTERRHYSDEEILADLAAGYRATGSPFSPASYEAWREQEVVQARKAGKSRRMPRPSLRRPALARGPTARKRALAEDQ